MTEEKISHSFTVGTSQADDVDHQRHLDDTNTKPFTSNRRSKWWSRQCVVIIMIIAVLSLAIGLGVGLNNSNRSETSLSNSENVTRSSWPELVGMDAENASAWIKERYPEYTVYVVDYDDYVTTDYDTKRVRIYKASNGTVVVVPKIGR